MGIRGFVTFASTEGPRHHQEDRFFHKRIDENGFYGHLLAVLDGHNGSEAAEVCAKSIGELFSLKNSAGAEDALRKLIAALSAKTRRLESGTTFSAALVLENGRAVSIAVVGDSPVVVIDCEGKVHVGPEHNVRTNLRERLAAEKRGGHYDGRYISNPHTGCGLQMSRALGDAPLGEIILREAEILTIRRPRWVLVASDGVLDPGHRNTAELIGELEKLARERVDAEGIINWAKKKGLRDNATAVLWESE